MASALGAPAAQGAAALLEQLELQQTAVPEAFLHVQGFVGLLDEGKWAAMRKKVTQIIAVEVGVRPGAHTMRQRARPAGTPASKAAAAQLANEWMAQRVGGGKMTVADWPHSKAFSSPFRLALQESARLPGHSGRATHGWLAAPVQLLLERGQAVSVHQQQGTLPPSVVTLCAQPLLDSVDGKKVAEQLTYLFSRSPVGKADHKPTIVALTLRSKYLAAKQERDELSDVHWIGPFQRPAYVGIKDAVLDNLDEPGLLPSLLDVLLAAAMHTYRTFISDFSKATAKVSDLRASGVLQPTSAATPLQPGWRRRAQQAARGRVPAHPREEDADGDVAVPLAMGFAGLEGGSPPEAAAGALLPQEAPAAAAAGTGLPPAFPDLEAATEMSTQAAVEARLAMDTQQVRNAAAAAGGRSKTAHSLVKITANLQGLAAVLAEEAQHLKDVKQTRHAMVKAQVSASAVALETAARVDFIVAVLARAYPEQGQPPPRLLDIANPEQVATLLQGAADAAGDDQSALEAALREASEAADTAEL